MVIDIALNHHSAPEVIMIIDAEIVEVNVIEISEENNINIMNNNVCIV